MKLQDVINKHYDSINDIGAKLMKRYKKVSLSKNIKDSTISITNNNDNKELLRFRYTCVGSYDPTNELWIWNYNNFSMDKKSKSYGETIMKMKEDIGKNIDKYEDIKYVEKVYNYLANEVCVINNKAIFDLVRVVLYCLKGKGVIIDSVNVDGLDKMDLYVVNSVVVNNI
jgi:hypothetical protein